MKKQTMTWLAVTLLVAAAGGGVWLWQRQQNDDEVATLTERVESLQSQATRLSQIQDDNLPVDMDSTTVTKLSNSNQPPVVFDPPGRFNSGLQSQIKSDVIAPHQLYSSDSDKSVAAYYVSESQVEAEYAVTAIFLGNDNSYESFLVSTADDLSWTPVCLDACNFSNEFKTTYPEIVKRAE